MTLRRVIAFLLRRFSSSAIDWIEAAELRRQLDGKAAPTVLDVRGADEFTGPLGHIASALNIPLGELEGRLGELRARSAGGITVVCRTDRRSATARAALLTTGFDRVTVLRGGMARWNALGFETVRDGGGASTAEKEPRS